MSCDNPIDAGVLADYWLAALPDAEEQNIEEHLFECDACGARLREMIVLAEGVRELARSGSLRMIVSDAFIKCAEEEGLRVRQYSPPPGGSVQCTVTAEDDILIGRLVANLSGVKRVDLSLRDERGIELRRLTDIPVHAGASGVIYQESITFAKAAPDNKMIMRMLGFDEAGAEYSIAEYRFNHKRSLPGPGAW
jgi:hypothetical protein